MSDNFDDFIPGVQLAPLAGYEDLADVLDPLTGRMIGRFGELGFTIEEAARSAAEWWETKGRMNMPDYGKPPEYLNAYGMKSGVLLGLPWAQLNRGERIRVIKVWHHEIGILHGIGIHNDKELQHVIKEEANRIELEKGRAFDLAQIIGGNPNERDGQGRLLH